MKMNEGEISVEQLELFSQKESSVECSYQTIFLKV